jgi:hypothetical protein
MIPMTADIRNNKTTDRLIILKTKEGMNTLSGSLTMDNRLLTGDNELHAIMDPQHCHWYLKYKHGVLPQPLQQTFTSFPRLLKFVTEYYLRRNIEVEKVID